MSQKEAQKRINVALKKGATELDLSGLGLTSLPESLGKLTQLTILDVSDNELTVLPECLGQLTQLQSLDVMSNQLTELPESLGQLTQLQSLDVMDNQLTELPESLGQLTQLQRLAVSGNRLTELPECLGRLTQLQSLRAARNQVTVLPESLGKLTQLTILDVSDNELTVLPECLGQLTQLQSLDVMSNQLTELPESLGQLTQLQRLDVMDNQLTELPESLGQLTQLQSLDVMSNQLTELPESLGQLTQLQSLDVMDNQLTELPESLGQLTQLQRLAVSGNRLTELPECLGRLTQLQSLRAARNQVTVLPESLGKLTQLTILDVSDNELTVLPECLGQLTQLQSLDVMSNQLTELPESLGQLTQLQSLDVMDNQLTELPESLGQLTQLQRLAVSGNRLTELPECLGRLTQLQSLRAARNQVTVLPESLGKLTQLTILDVSDNELTVLPESLCSSSALSIVDAYMNNLSDLPDCLTGLGLKELWLQGNPRLGISQAVLGKYVESWSRREEYRVKSPGSILDAYFAARSLDGRPLNEIKLVLVGRGAAGKTSIARRLVKGTFCRNCKETQGIDISTWKVDCAGQTVKVNIWDFAGQVVTHSTHQFFLSESSVYVLVLTGREDTQKLDAEYWLRLIRAFACDEREQVAPVIVVLNKFDQHPFKVDRNALQEKYPFIAGFIKADCKSGLGIDALKSRLAEAIGAIPIVRQPFKLSWWKIKQRLEKAQRRQHYFPYRTFQAICAKEGETEADRQRFLADVFHVLGVALNYGDDPRLREATVLNPHWVTGCIYTLLREGVPDDGSALLTMQRVREVLKDEPDEMRRYLVELMRRFDLAFPLNEGADSWLVPQRLPAEQPDLGEAWRNVAEATRLHYRYPVVPEGLLPRFISRTYPLSESPEEEVGALPRWANGVVLADGGARALIRVDAEERRVDIVVTGAREARLSLLGVIQSDFRTIHADISGLDEVEELELEDRPGVFVPVRTLRADEVQKRQSAAATESGTITVDPVTELNRLSEPRAREDGWHRPRIFISYSSHDARQMDELLVRLKPLKETHGLVEIWHDRCIPPGGDWDGEIRAELARADIVLLLVSNRFLASDYIRGVEVQNAVGRAKEGKSVVVPIILEKCDWTKELFGKSNALPRKGAPIRDARPQRNAWHTVAGELKKVLEDVVKRQISEDGTGRPRVRVSREFRVVF
jgi:internalin A